MRAALPCLLLALHASSATAFAAAATPVPPDAGAVAPGGASATTTAPAEATPATAVPDLAALRREREEVYGTFRREFEARRYAEALPHAERVVELTERMRAEDLPSALSNLGATHLQLSDHVAAEKAYLEALRLVEESQGSASRRLLTPLRGLASTYVAGGRKDAAVPLLERAVAIVRRSDGLFDPGQLPLLEPLIDGYVATGQWQQAEQSHQYAFRLAERMHGASPKLVPALTKLAKWYEETGRYTQARRTWARQYAVSTPRGGEGGDLAGAVNALRGMARTYKLEYQYGPEVVETEETADLSFRMDAVERDPFGRRIASLSQNEYRLDPQGREFLEAALQMLEKHQPPAPLAVATLLVELGDWTQLAERPGRAQPFWERAWPLLPREDATAEAPKNPLLYPGQLLYRAPVAARRHKQLPREAVVERDAIAEFTVTAEGRVRDVRIVEGDASEAQRNALASALSRAVYRPRFVDGQAVETQNVRYRETFRVLRTDATDDAPSEVPDVPEAADPSATPPATNSAPSAP